MRPVQSPEASQLHGAHFFVDKDGLLQPYEYADRKTLDMSNHWPFLTEFCHTILDRGLHQQFGLNRSKTDEAGWTVLKFPEQRSNIIIPQGMPIPHGEFDVNVVTEWDAGTGGEDRDPRCRHCTHCEHCGHIDQLRNSEEAGLHFGEAKIEPGTSVYDLITGVMKVW